MAAPRLIKRTRPRALSAPPPPSPRRPRNRQSVSRNLAAVGVMIFIEFVLLLAFTISSPLVYRRPILTDEQTGARSLGPGVCSSDGDLGFVLTIGSYHLVVLLYGFVTAVRTSRLHSAFSEGKQIRYAMFNGLQFSALAIPVLYITTEAGTAMLLRSGAIALHDMALLSLLFLPKLQMVIFGVGTHDGEGKHAIETAVQRAKTASDTGSGSGSSNSNKGSSKKGWSGASSSRKIMSLGTSMTDTSGGHSYMTASSFNNPVQVQMATPVGSFEGGGPISGFSTDDDEYV